MSEKTILDKIEQVAADADVKSCLLELVEFERGSESGRAYTSEYKSVLQRWADSGSTAEVSGGPA